MMGPIKNLRNKPLLTENICIFYAVATLLLFSSCNSAERDCSKFRTGKFLTQTEINDTIYSSVFTRSGNIQVENFNNSIDSSREVHSISRYPVSILFFILDKSTSTVILEPPFMEIAKG